MVLLISSFFSIDHPVYLCSTESLVPISVRTKEIYATIIYVDFLMSIGTFGSLREMKPKLYSGK